MKKILLVLLLSTAALLSLSALENAALTITNNLEDAVYYLYLSPEDEYEWGNDRLGDDVFDSGTSLELEIEYDENAPLYKLMAEDDSEKSYRIEGIDLRSSGEIVLSSENFIPFGGWDPLMKTIRFNNETGEDIYYLYVSSKDSMYWGEDILGDDILYNGDSISIEVPIDRDYPVNDILAEGESGSSYEKMEVDMLEQDEFALLEDDLSYENSDDEDFDYDSYDANEDGEEYLRGYREGFTDAWKEAYSQGFRDAMEE